MATRDHDSCAPDNAAGGYPSDCELTQGLLARSREADRPVPRSEAWRQALSRAAQVQLLLLDVDGVLTDGTIIYGADEEEAKGFSTQDGFGLRLLREAGVAVGIITARRSQAVTRRAENLGLTHVYQGVGKKNEVFETILRETGLRPPQIGYMGDDWLDLELLARVGLAAAPANAVAEVRQRVHYVTDRSGGRGAVRELCELILEARGDFSTLLRKYS